MNSGEAYISLADYVPGLAKREPMGLSRSHSFTPLISKFAGPQWRKISDGIYTHVRPEVEIPQNGADFKIRVSAHPAIADDVLRKAVPHIVKAGCQFKVIANSALLEFVCSKSLGDGDADFLIVYPRSQDTFKDLSLKLQHAVDGFRTANLSLPLPDANPRKALTADSPWPGLDYFGPGDTAYFFGRKDESEELARRLKQGVVTVVLGPPGVGKTSLVCAGLKPHLDAARFEPIYLRLRYGSGVHPVQQIRDEINCVLSERKIDGAPFAESKTLWEYFRLQKSTWLGADRKPVTPVLIFDQFEDVFSFHGSNLVVRDEIEAFWSQLSALAENRIPATVSQLDLPFPDLRRERELFKIVLSLRLEHLQKLLARRGQMPTLAQNQFTLQPMNGRKALESVLGAGRALFDPAGAEMLAQHIVRRIERESAQPPETSAEADGSFQTLERLRVEPALLSFFCEQLNEARKRLRDLDPTARYITVPLLDNAGERIFDDFFQRTNLPRPKEAQQKTKNAERKARGEIEVISPPHVPGPLPNRREYALIENSPSQRPRSFVSVLVVLALIILPVTGVFYFEQLQQQQTEKELKAYVSHLSVGEGAIASAREKLNLAQSNLAYQKANLYQLAEQVRAREKEAQDVMAQNAKLAHETTNIQSRVTQLNEENAQAKSRLAQYGSFLVDLTNQLISVNKENQDLHARNAALAVSNALAARNAALALSNSAVVASNAALAASNAAAALALARAQADAAAKAQAAALADSSNSTPASPPPAIVESLENPAAADSATEPAGPVFASVLAAHGQCFYSREGARFHPLESRVVLLQDSVVRTGKKSYADLFIRGAGATIRVGPESEVRIATLAATARHGLAATDAVLELRDGRIFAVVRDLPPASSLAVKDFNAQSSVACGGIGSFLISVTGTTAADKLSVAPLGVVNQRGKPMDPTGQNYHFQNIARLTLVPAALQSALDQLDELESETDKALSEVDSQQVSARN